jgi:hypothetical protein
MGGRVSLDIDERRCLLAVQDQPLLDELHQVALKVDSETISAELVSVPICVCLHVDR